MTVNQIYLKFSYSRQSFCWIFKSCDKYRNSRGL